METISSMKKLRRFIKELDLGLHGAEEDKLVISLYEKIEHSRQVSYKNGYDQGRFDEKIEWIIS